MTDRILNELEELELTVTLGSCAQIDIEPSVDDRIALIRSTDSFGQEITIYLASHQILAAAMALLDIAKAFSAGDKSQQDSK
jgi:hypothetical protein